MHMPLVIWKGFLQTGIVPKMQQGSVTCSSFNHAVNTKPNVIAIARKVLYKCL